MESFSPEALQIFNDLNTLHYDEPNFHSSMNKLSSLTIEYRSRILNLIIERALKNNDFDRIIMINITMN